MRTSSPRTSEKSAGFPRVAERRQNYGRCAAFVTIAYHEQQGPDHLNDAMRVAKARSRRRTEG